ncbi:hypothetical protein L7F22_032671 [Adiantum nelumboides]|nr:hypothetical protein [Adiantum nelumboides]
MALAMAVATPVVRNSCPFLPCQLPPYPDKLLSCVFSRRSPCDIHGRLGFHFKFSPAAASISSTKTPHFSFHTGSGRRAATVALALPEQKEDLGDAPSLPYTVNNTLTVENWGSLYTGPNEIKYWNPNRNFPYTIGYTSLKSYKGKVYVQKVEQGEDGPVFIVEVVGENKSFSSKSPQKVWTDVVEGDGLHVQGARHFGFQSHDVVEVLQAFHQSQNTGSTEKVSTEGNLGLQDTPFASITKKTLSEDLKNYSDNEFASVFDVDSDDEPLAGFEEEIDEAVVEEGNDDGVNKMATLAAKLDDEEEEEEDNGEVEEGEDNESEEEDDEEEDDVIGEDILHDVENHDVDASHHHDHESDDDDVAEEEEEEEEDNQRDSLSFDEYSSNRRGHIDDESPAFDDTSPLANNYKQSFRSAPTESGFDRFDSVDEPYKEDIGVVNNNVYYPSDQGRSKIVGRVWRKGNTMVSQGKQQGMERQGTDQRYASNDGPQSRASTRPWDASFGKKREENTRSSQMLLELLQKWNKARKWNRDLGTRPKIRAERKSLQMRDDNEPHQEVQWGDERVLTSMNKPSFQGHGSEAGPFSARGNLSSRNYEGQELTQSSQSSLDNGELALDDFKIDEDVDESTEFAISKLFETVGKKEALPSSSQTSPRIAKVVQLGGQKMVNHVEKSWIRGGIGKPLNIEDYQTRVESGDDMKPSKDSGDIVKHIKEKNQGEPHPVFRSEKKVVNGEVSGALIEDARNQSTRLIAREAETSDKKQNEEMKLINNVRKLVGSKRHEDALLAVRSAKASSVELHVDVYEALLGDVKLATWQKDVFKHVQDGNSVLVSAPSGSGKSVAADCCLFRNFIEEHRTLFVTPSEHLAKEKVHTLGSIFGHRHVGGTRMRMQKDHKFVVLTLDSLAKMLQELHGPGGSEFRFFFEGINVVVLDKFHTMGDSKYAKMWEEVCMLLDAKIKVLALTLPASNADQIVSWIGMHRGPCKLVSCMAEPVIKRYLFCNGQGMFSLLDAGAVMVSDDLLENCGSYRNSMMKEQLESFFFTGYDKPSLRQALVSLRKNAMLPALVAFSAIAGCNEAIQDASAALGDGLLSNQELATLEARCAELGETHPDLMEHLEQADREALLRGFAACHEGKLPAWQTFVIKLFQENILKLLIVSHNIIFHTGVVARTIILPATYKVTKDGVSPLSAVQALPLFGSAGRRGYDIEGNVIFLQSVYSGPNEAASLVLKGDLDIVSNYKPSYSLVVNLMAKYQLLKVRQLLSSTLHDVVYYNTHYKEKLFDEMDRRILDSLESKGDLEVKLFLGLAEVNKQKLADAAVFTRVDIRLTIHSVSHGGNTFPGFLLAVVPDKTDSFYMVFGSDNNFHLLPAGAFDHVYTTESPPLDVLYGQSTGQTLQPPVIPSKERWTVEHDGTGGYVASGSSQTQQYVKVLMDFPIQVTAVKEGLQLRKEILSLDSQISSLIQKRRSLREKQSGEVELSGLHEVENAPPSDLEERETWKEALRLVKVMEQADALALTESQGAHVKLKPLGMLISRLHNVDNELWLALVLTSSHVKQLPPGEFMAIIAATVPLEKDVENLFDDQLEFMYRPAKPLKDTFAKLEVLRKQVAALQESLTPPLHLCTSFAVVVYAWSRGKPGTIGFNLENMNDGEVAWRLKSVGRHAKLISRACSQVSVDLSEPNDFSSLSMLARKAEDSLSKHLVAVDQNVKSTKFQ